MKISTKDFRIQTNETVDLSHRPTRVKPDYNSKDQYQEVLAEHVKLLSDGQRVHYASNHYALLLIFQALDGGQGRIDPARHVGS